MGDLALRLECLRLAVESKSSHVAATAQEFYDFATGGNDLARQIENKAVLILSPQALSEIWAIGEDMARGNVRRANGVTYH